MNLLSPPTKFYCEAGEFQVIVENQLVFTQGVQPSPGGTIEVDLVPILAQCCDTSYPEGKMMAKHQVQYQCYLNNTPLESGYFYNSIADDAPRYVGNMFIPGVPVAVTYNQSIRVDQNVIPAEYPTKRVVTPTTNLVIDGKEFTPSSCGWSLDYLSSNGQWHFFASDTNVNLTVTPETVSVSKNRRQKESVMSKVSASYQLTSGWLSEDDSFKFAQDVLTSPAMILHIDGQSIPVSIVPNSVKVMNIADGVISYDFQVTKNNNYILE